MSILITLRNVPPHPAQAIFKDLPRAGVALYLNINSTYLSSILAGSKKASPELDARIMALAAEVIEARKVEAAQATERTA